MSVYRIEAGRVVQVWHDCATLAEWIAKYPGSAVRPNREGDAVVGQIEDASGALSDPLPQPPTAGEVRAERNARISATDWTQLSDAPLTADRKAAFAAYRQALRDLPTQNGFPGAVEWPVEP